MTIFIGAAYARTLHAVNQTSFTEEERKNLSDQLGQQKFFAEMKQSVDVGVIGENEIPEKLLKAWAFNNKQATQVTLSNILNSCSSRKLQTIASQFEYYRSERITRPNLNFTIFPSCVKPNLSAPSSPTHSASSQVPNLNDSPFVHANLDRTNATELLQGCDSGCFLLRISSENNMRLVISSKIYEEVKHSFVDEIKDKNGASVSFQYPTDLIESSGMPLKTILHPVFSPNFEEGFSGELKNISFDNLLEILSGLGLREEFVEASRPREGKSSLSNEKKGRWILHNWVLTVLKNKECATLEKFETSLKSTEAGKELWEEVEYFQLPKK